MTQAATTKKKQGDAVAFALVAVSDAAKQMFDAGMERPAVNSAVESAVDHAAYTSLLALLRQR